MWDIVYSEFNRFRDARKDKEEQFNIAKGIVKKAFLRFYLDWTAYRNTSLHGYKWASDILLDYSKLFIDVSVEVYEILPKRLIDEVTSIVTKIREAANDMKFVTAGDSYDTIFSKSDECAQDAFRVYNTFDEYFQNI